MTDVPPLKVEYIDSPSVKQMKYLTELVHKRASVLGVSVTPEIENWLSETTKFNASIRIEKAIIALNKAHEEKAKHTHSAAEAAFYEYVECNSIDEGLYVVDTHDKLNYYFVVTSGIGRKYAKRFDDISKSYKYSPGGIYTVAKSGKKITLEEASKIGKAIGVCMCCGRTLTHPDSIKSGIGPICASKYF